MTGALEQGPLSGRTIGSWQLGERLGQGGMGVVYRAVGPRGVAALKLLQTDNVELRLRFRREAEAVARVGDHGGVARVYGAELDGPQPWIAFEFARSGTLRDRLQEGVSWSEEALLELGSSLAAALAHLHQAGIIHRDLKPTNILYDGDRLLVADFGLARITDAETLTRTGTSLGTPVTMAPEQFEGQTPTPAVDTRAFGVILWWAAAGRAPFRAETMEGWYHAIALQQPPSLTDERPELDPRLSELVMACLALKPEERPPDGAALVEELTAIRTGTLSLGAQANRRRKIVMALTLALLIGVATVAFVKVWLPARRERLRRAALAVATARKNRETLKALARDASAARADLLPAARTVILRDGPTPALSVEAVRWCQRLRAFRDQDGANDSAPTRLRGVLSPEAFLMAVMASHLIDVSREGGSVAEAVRGLATIPIPGYPGTPGDPSFGLRKRQGAQVPFGEVLELHRRLRSRSPAEIAAAVERLATLQAGFSDEARIPAVLVAARARLMVRFWVGDELVESRGVSEARATLIKLDESREGAASAALAEAFTELSDEDKRRASRTLLRNCRGPEALLSFEVEQVPGNPGAPFFPPPRQLDPLAAEVYEVAARDRLRELETERDADRCRVLEEDGLCFALRGAAAQPWSTALAARADARWARRVLTSVAAKVLIWRGDSANGSIRSDVKPRPLRPILNLRLGAARLGLLFTSPHSQNLEKEFLAKGAPLSSFSEMDRELIRMWSGEEALHGKGLCATTAETIAAARRILLSDRYGDLIRAEAAHRLTSIDNEIHGERYALSRIITGDYSAKAKADAQKQYDAVPEPLRFNQREVSEMLRLCRVVADEATTPPYPLPDQLPKYVGAHLLSQIGAQRRGVADRVNEATVENVIECLELAYRGHRMRTLSDKASSENRRFLEFESALMRDLELSKIATHGARANRMEGRFDEAAKWLARVPNDAVRPVVYWYERFELARRSGKEAELVEEIKDGMRRGFVKEDDPDTLEILRAIEAHIANSGKGPVDPEDRGS